MRNTSRRTTLLAATAFAATLMSSTARADVIHADDVIITSNTCVGAGCVNGEMFDASRQVLKIKALNTQLRFEDTSTGFFPSNDWRIIANDTAEGGSNFLAIEDIDGATRPFTVSAGAPTDALFIDSAGRIGMGTNTPQEELHIVDGVNPSIRLEQDASGGFAPQTWDIFGNATGFFVKDETASKTPFNVLPGAADDSLIVTANGNIASQPTNFAAPNPTPDFGTGPASHYIHRTNGTASILVEEVNSTPAVRNMLQFTNNGGSYMTFKNTATDQSWFFLHEQAAPNRFIITSSASAGPKFTLTNTGNLTIPGTITTGGGTCGSGCDRVFDADYELPTIEQHASQMWEKKHLPEVGPTPEGKPINLTDKLGRVINELEKAHIYIEQLHIEKKETKARLAAQDDRLSRLERLIN